MNRMNRDIGPSTNTKSVMSDCFGIMAVFGIAIAIGGCGRVFDPFGVVVGMERRGLLRFGGIFPYGACGSVACSFLDLGLNNNNTIHAILGAGSIRLAKLIIMYVK